MCIPYILAVISWAGFAAEAPAKPAPSAEIDAGQSKRPIKRTGDQITLKSGKVLHGVKIVRKTSVSLILEVIPGIEPLVIPAKQVASIKYGALSPRYDQPDGLAVSDPPERVDVVPAVKTSPALIRKLTVPFIDEAVTYSEQDILNVLRSVSILSGVPIEIDPTLAEAAPERRRVSMRLPAGLTMEAFLKEVIPENAPWLGVGFDFEALRFGYRGEEDASQRPPSGREDEKPGEISTGLP